MVKSKVWLSLVSLLLTAALVLSGCSTAKTPKEALAASMAKSSEMKSYSFKGNLKVEDLNFPAAQSSDAAAQAAGLNMLKNMEFSWTGVYKADPMQMEMTMSLALKGDMAINLNVPIVVTKEKMWVKIPNIPMLPIPDNVKNKFLEIDMKKLAQQSGQQMPTIDPSKSQKMMNDIFAIVFNNIDEKQYLSDVKIKDAGLPQDVDVKHVVHFAVTKDQVEPFVKTLVEKIAPQVIDLLSKNEEYRNMLQLKPSDLDQAKKGLDKAKNESMSQAMADFKKQVKSLDVTANMGIDKQQFPVYTDLHVKTVVDMNGQSGTVAFKAANENQDINKDVKFAIGIPKDIITLDEFNKETGGMFGGASGNSGM